MKVEFHGDRMIAEMEEPAKKAETKAFFLPGALLSACNICGVLSLFFSFLACFLSLFRVILGFLHYGTAYIRALYPEIPTDVAEFLRVSRLIGILGTVFSGVALALTTAALCLYGKRASGRNAPGLICALFSVALSAAALCICVFLLF